jgi:hypothetical protein
MGVYRENRRINICICKSLINLDRPTKLCELNSHRKERRKTKGYVGEHTICAQCDYRSLFGTVVHYFVPVQLWSIRCSIQGAISI